LGTLRVCCGLLGCPRASCLFPPFLLLVSCRLPCRPLSRSLAVSLSRCLALSLSRSLTLSFSRSLALSLSRSLALSLSLSLPLSLSFSLSLSPPPSPCRPLSLSLCSLGKCCVRGGGLNLKTHSHTRMNTRTHAHSHSNTGFVDSWQTGFVSLGWLGKPG
jgi:hypothetical protein